MFIKFEAVKGGSIYIRAEDWRSMVDERDDTAELQTELQRSQLGDLGSSYEGETKKLVIFDEPPPHCRIGYVPQNTTEMIYVLALGSANDEMKAAIEYEQAQRRQQEQDVRLARGIRGGGAR